MFFKIGVHRNFAILTGKNLHWRVFLTNLQGLRPATSFERGFNTGVFLEIFRTAFFIEHPQWQLLSV